MNDKVRRLIKTIRHKKGQGLVEYALLASLIALAAIFALGEIGKSVFVFFTDIVGKLTAINIGK